MEIRKCALIMRNHVRRRRRGGRRGTMIRGSGMVKKMETKRVQVVEGRGWLVWWFWVWEWRVLLGHGGYRFAAINEGRGPVEVVLG